MDSLSRAFLLIALCSVGLTACSLEPKSKYSRIHLSFLFPERASNSFLNPVDLIATSASSPVWEKVAPATSAAFPCYGVNVVGPGIADTSVHPERNFDFNALLTRQSYCSHRGIISGPIYPGSGPIDVSLQIPSGAQRIVQVIGVTPAAACPTAFLADDSGGEEGDAYELGRVVADVFADRSFTIPKEYPQGAGTTDTDRAGRLVSCGDGNNGNPCAVTSGGGSEAGGIMLTSTYKGAQRVLVSQPTYLKQIDLYLKNPFTAQNVTVRVYSDSSGNPGTVVDASRAVAISTIPASVSQWSEFHFGSPGDYHLLAVGTYWIVVEPASSVFWHSGASGSPGQAKIATTVGWTAASRMGAVTKAATGFNATCSVTGGSLRCGGLNTTAVFGDGYSPDSERPFFGTNSTLNVVESVAISQGFACAIVSGGQLSCWGTNGEGQLGQGNTSTYSVPQVVSALASGTLKVDTGNSHACAITSTGAVYCWGNNLLGAIGDGTTTNRTTPLQIIASGATDVDVGGLYSCAVVSGGAQCWGQNDVGQLGDGSNTYRTVPTVASGLSSGVSAISAGFNTTCAVVSGTVRCWGKGNLGQLGNGSSVDSNVSVPVTGLSNIVQVAVSEGHACALSSGGAVSCWGENIDGQLGNGTTTGSNVPVPVSGMASGVTAIFSGTTAKHTCAIQNGDLYCWGDNSYWQQARGYDQTDALVPTLIRGADQFAHRFHSCVD